MVRTIAKDHGEKRDAILKTAATFFAENGFDRASMSQLASECGISKALIYHYYASKEVLLYDIIHTHLKDLVEAVEAVEPVDDPEQHLRNLVHAILNQYRDADAEHKLQLEATKVLPKVDQDQLADLQRQLVVTFSTVIKSVSPDYFENRQETLRPVTMSLFGMLNWFYMWYRRGKGMTRPQYADLATELLLGGIKGLEES
ncbi:TetR/AcrR family transcriptional regulator [Maritalea myrionectae]|uniref:Putative HTH-type transcriptional regulator YerO n=1 Tax=Maritalea myrionectae TaxID=454601 RepID=A0A2R4MI65_9HYPH|nr:TetR/AcrR family transcriptional regulator [Maritalea myrionectae]AVX05670.1 putative HTH-type transcriptional regulator YerO [Maritalea myrionectae]